MPITLFNVFVVPLEEEAEFLENFRNNAQVFAQATGFIESHLHRNTGVGDPTFRFINVATWASIEDWKAAVKAARFDRSGVSAIEAHPALFESVLSINAQDAKD